jgi:peptide-methionine (S)-S-oxide reductase
MKLMGEIKETITLGGGCFWCMEAVFSGVKGVTQVTSGYAGGHSPEPTYAEVCSGTTGHAEVVQLVWDPAQVSLASLLTVFFHLHNPTTLNRQGADVGTQYRSIILYHRESHRPLIEDFMVKLQEEQLWEDPFVTEVLPFQSFTPAETEHHDYYRRNPTQGYCQMAIAPKMAKLHREFGHLMG